MNTHALVRRTAALVSLAAVGLATAACGGQQLPPNKPGEGGEVRIELTPDGCAPSPASLPAGTVTFHLHNTNAGNVTEAELLSGGNDLAEKEDVTPGLSGDFSAHLDPGSYQLTCPGAKHDKADFKVTGVKQGS